MGSVRAKLAVSSEQIVMWGHSEFVILAALLSLSYSQYWSPLQFGGPERRRLARRVSSFIRQTDNNNIGSVESTRRMFSPIFSEDLTDFNAPYRSIDSMKFTVLPAVPNQRSQESLNSKNNQNFLFTSTSNLKPIPAVPIPAQKPKTTKKPKTVRSQDSSSRRTTPRPVFPSSDPTPQMLTSNGNVEQKQRPSKEERKKFKACHGRCVQKFCLPVGTLAKHSACQGKCKDICSQ